MRYLLSGILLLAVTVSNAQIDVVNQMRGHGKDWSQSSNCRAYYPFEGAAGTGEGQTWDDACASGTDNDLVTFGSPHPGRLATCGDAFSSGTGCYENDTAFSGGEYTTPDSSEFDVGGAVTWGCKMYVYNTSANYGVMDNANFISGVEIRADSTGAIVGGVGTVPAFSATSSWSTNTWTSVIVRWSPTQGTVTGGIEIYVNGVMKCVGGAGGCTANVVTNNADANRDLFIGSAYGSALAGRLDDCFILAQYITPAEICGIANFGFKGNDVYRGVC